MRALPVELIFSCSYEEVRSPSYDWDNRLAGPAGCHIFQYNLSGGGFYESEDEGLLAWPTHHAMLAQRNEPSRYFYPPGGTELWTHCWMNFFGADAFWQEVRQQYGSIVPLHPEGETLRAFRNLAERRENHAIRDRLEGSALVYEFLMALVRELESSPQLNASPIQDAVRYLQDHHNRPLTVKELADRAGYTREHFTRLFHEEMGESPGTMLRRLRLKTASLLLQAYSMPVKEVARQSGFSDPVAFNRAFVQAKGCTPLTFRQRERATYNDQIDGERSGNQPRESELRRCSARE